MSENYFKDEFNNYIDVEDRFVGEYKNFRVSILKLNHIYFNVEITNKQGIEIYNRNLNSESIDSVILQSLGKVKELYSQN